MKKTLKKTGVAILTMAMLLSMGAMTAITASAAGESITVSESTGLKAGDAVCVYKVATKTDSGWEWETPYKKVTGISWAQIGTFEDYSDKAMKLAVMLANVENDTFVKGVVGTPISVSGAGYYLVKAAPQDAGFVAQPMLIEIKDGETPTISYIKTSQISLTKVITKVNDSADKVATGGKSAEAAAGETIHYRIVAEIPSYSPDATAIQDFVLTDKSDATLTSKKANTFKVVIGTAADTAVDAAGVIDASAVLDRKDGQNFTVTLPGMDPDTTDYAYDVQDNGGKYLIVEFDAVLGDDPTISQGKGAGTTVDDAKRADANKNDVTLTYGNNYSTGGGSDTDGDGDVDKDDEQPELKDFADVYTSLLNINKTLNGTAAKKGDAGFALYADKGCTKVVRDEVKTDANGIVAFKGLASGTYYLKEKTTPGGYKTAAVATVKLDVDDAKAVYVAPAGFTAIADGGFETTIDNPSLETLPATGGIGTYLFTIGGVSIVLLAGVLFVIYMKKRETEE
jgi:fimbrial isopeptide formation D2 family protein/LPXTG-motif cell wall-anchored protein